MPWDGRAFGRRLEPARTTRSSSQAEVTHDLLVGYTLAALREVLPGFLNSPALLVSLGLASAQLSLLLSQAHYTYVVGPRPDLVNLPHAHTIVGRLVHYLHNREEPTPVERTGVLELLAALDEVLRPYPADPPLEIAVPVAGSAAEHARRLVGECVRAGYRGDRLGQCIRNLFECLGLAEEGAALSLKCGERPDSPLRP